MFASQIEAVKANITRVEEKSTPLQRKGIVGTLQKIGRELEDLVFGIELDNVNNNETKEKEVK